MQTSDLAASMVIVGDVLHDAGTPFLVLDRDMKPGGRIRFTLLQEDGGQGLRIHRTYEPGRLLRVEPLGAARVVQASFHLQVSVSNFLKEPA